MKFAIHDIHMLNGMALLNRHLKLHFKDFHDRLFTFLFLFLKKEKKTWLYR